VVLTHAKNVVQNDDAGNGGRRCWDREPSRHLAPRCRDEHVGHVRFPTLDGGLAADMRFYSQTGLLNVNSLGRFWLCFLGKSANSRCYRQTGTRHIAMATQILGSSPPSIDRFGNRVAGDESRKTGIRRDSNAGG
jgi:hypothetical protein